MSVRADIGGRRSLWLAPCLALAAAMGASLGLAESAAAAAALAAGVVVYLLFAAASVRTPLLFAAVLLLSLETLPPFYFSALGETPVYAALPLLPIGFAIVLLRFPDFNIQWDPVATGLAVFLFGTALSLPFAWWFSGIEAGMFSLSRWIMLANAGLAYYLIRGGARLDASRMEHGLFALLFAGALVSAGYGIVDFFWPVPIPHPAADQFIWLEGAVLRRAQGVFYESSSFANFCGFFLAAGAIALLARKERYLGMRRLPLAASVSVLALAVLVAFSRSAWASVFAALLAASVLLGFVKIRRGLTAALALAVSVLLLWQVSPELWDYLVSSRIGRLVEIFHDPNAATSGRFDTWVQVVSIIQEHPQHLIFGIGYKTLPVTRVFGSEIITDNGYLSLLVETGVAGLAGFMILTGAVLKTFFRLTRSADGRVAFWSAVVFSIWCGQLTLLLAADAYTYWRNMTVIAALMALTMNIADRARVSRGER
jgi:O-antigen ligase